jgi:hypothetical protein
MTDIDASHKRSFMGRLTSPGGPIRR